MVWDTPLISLDQLSQLSPLSCFCPPASLLLRMGKALVLYKHCPGVAKTLVCYQHLLQNTPSWKVLCKLRTPPQPNNTVIKACPLSAISFSLSIWYLFVKWLTPIFVKWKRTQAEFSFPGETLVVSPQTWRYIFNIFEEKWDYSKRSSRYFERQSTVISEKTKVISIHCKWIITNTCNFER